MNFYHGLTQDELGELWIKYPGGDWALRAVRSLYPTANGMALCVRPFDGYDVYLPNEDGKRSTTRVSHEAIVATLRAMLKA